MWPISEEYFSTVIFNKLVCFPLLYNISVFSFSLDLVNFWGSEWKKKKKKKKNIIVKSSLSAHSTNFDHFLLCYHFYSWYCSFCRRNQQNLVYCQYLSLVSSVNPRCLLTNCAGANVVCFQMTFFDSHSKICSHLNLACLTVHTPTQTGHCSLFIMLENHVWTCVLKKKIMWT